MILQRILGRIILVVLLTVTMDLVTGTALETLYKRQSSGEYYRANRAINSTEAEVVIFGSSRAAHHYDPAIFHERLGLTFFNTGRDGTAMLYQLAVLKAMLQRHTPDLIVLDYAPLHKLEESYFDRLSMLLPYYREHKEIRDIVAYKSPYEHIKMVSRVYPYNSQVLDLIKGSIRTETSASERDGYIPLYGEGDLELDTFQLRYGYTHDQVKSKALDDFLSIAKHSGAEVVVINSPYFGIDSFLEELEHCKVMCTLHSVPFWDFSKDRLFHTKPSWFQDKAHLNHTGAEAFSSRVCDSIKTNVSEFRITIPHGKTNSDAYENTDNRHIAAKPDES